MYSVKRACGFVFVTSNFFGLPDLEIVLCLTVDRDRDAPGLDTVIPLESAVAYNMMDVITGVSRFLFPL